MKKYCFVLLSILIMTTSAYSTAQYGIVGTITNLMELNEKLCFQFKKTDGTYMKFYVTGDPSNHANPCAFVYQAYQNTWTVVVGYDDSITINPGDGICYSVIRIHTYGY